MYHCYFSNSIKEHLVEVIKEFIFEKYEQPINIIELYDDNIVEENSIVIEYNKLECSNDFNVSFWLYIHNTTILDDFVFFDFLYFTSTKLFCDILVSTTIDPYTYIMIDKKQLYYLVEIDGNNTDPCPKIFSKEIVNQEFVFNLLLD